MHGSRLDLAPDARRTLNQDCPPRVGPRRLFARRGAPKATRRHRAGTARVEKASALDARKPSSSARRATRAGCFVGDRNVRLRPSARPLRRRQHGVRRLRRASRATFGESPQALLDAATTPSLLPRARSGSRSAELAREETRHPPSLGAGADGNVTPLHHDTAHNLIAHVYGKKRFLCFAPEDTARLYPHPKSSRYPHVSRVNPERPTLETFPAFAGARAFGAVLEAGELLYLPPGFWHHVRSLGVTISVNTWWAPPGVRLDEG